MGKVVSIVILCLCLFAVGFGITSCQKVEAGYVGVKVNLLGSSKGVDSEVLKVGRYFIGFNEELYLFPVFQQTVEWKSTNNNNGEFQFQSKEGLSLTANVSMSYVVNEDKVATLFQTYRKGIDEITNTYLYNIVRDTMVQRASVRTAENLYGEGKNEFVSEVTTIIREKMKPIGIDIDYIAIIGNVWLPENVKRAIDEKVKAGQLAAQRETEVLTAKAEADKMVAAAEGEARSKKAIADAEAYSIITRAEAQKEANEKLSKSITPELVEYNKIVKWDGKMPQVTGGGVPILSIGNN